MPYLLVYTDMLILAHNIRHGLISVILHTFVSNIDLHTIVSMLLLTT